MPRIFDNIDQSLLPALQNTLKISERADFCVGYFNLRGWQEIEQLIDVWSGNAGNCCRLLIGMQTLPENELKASRSVLPKDVFDLDEQTAERIKRKVAEEFRRQLTIGAPTNRDEKALRCLSEQIKAGKVQIRLFLRHPLHAKLYLLHRPNDPNNPITGFLGSSNLTLAGLSRQGELNVDVMDYDATHKLANWFEDRWNDRWCKDISEKLVEIIDGSWASPELVPPYHIYLKMAYHLSQEAQAGLSEYSIPRDFGRQLFDFQVAAVKIAARYLNKRGGVMIGDVVGLGKTLMATALARIFQDDQGLETLIICPKNLVEMWKDYKNRYRLLAEIMPISQVTRDLKSLRRFRLVLIDESHNLRNREGKRFKAIQQYIDTNDSKCILLTATPYNKSFLDLSAQLRLFIEDNQDLGIRPEKLITTIGEDKFIYSTQCQPKTLAAFEKSEYIDDWRDLMRLYLVRRTRGFIQRNYATTDKTTGKQYLTYEDGSRSYFPKRLPKTVRFEIDEHNHDDPYARLYSNEVVNAINSLSLPRYGLGSYIANKPAKKPNAAEQKIIANLGRARQRLKGFCRTNLFKRLESGGPAFIQSLERHILRNFVFLYALENNLDLPIGTQDAELLDPSNPASDRDADNILPIANNLFDDTDDEADDDEQTTDNNIELVTSQIDNPIAVTVSASPSTYGSYRTAKLQNEADYRRFAALVYQNYATHSKNRFKWIRSDLFHKNLIDDLQSDVRTLLQISQSCGAWNVDYDHKLAALLNLIVHKHPQQKILIFSQFADTVRYLVNQLRANGITQLEGVTGDSDNPTALAHRFSPVSNHKRDQISQEQELRVLVSTDVLSEGQNLQDAAIVVNYDLPWAIIRLIQRAGRVDRIGQQAGEIFCYTFLPADGVERIIRLRSRVRQRLRENAEVVGTDETFFEEDAEANQTIIDLYNEKAGVLDKDGDDDDEVDLASYAYQIWRDATDKNPHLRATITALPNVSFATRQYSGLPGEPPGVLLYTKTGAGNDALAWLDQYGQTVSTSQLAILKKAYCEPNTPPIERNEQHHLLVEQGLKHIAEAELEAIQKQKLGGQLGKPHSARRRTYDRLDAYAAKSRGGLFENTQEHQTLEQAIDQIHRFPLTKDATDTLSRQLRSSIKDETLAHLVINLYNETRLCDVPDEKQPGDQEQLPEPQIVCSMGLFNSQ